MNTKHIIIAVSILLVLCLAFGYTSYNQAIEFVTDKVSNISTLSQKILKISGVDFNDRVDLYVPSLENSNFGNWLNADGELMSVKTTIEEMLPNYLTNEKSDFVEVSIYPTFYSADFKSAWSNYTMGYQKFKEAFGDSLWYKKILDLLPSLPSTIDNVRITSSDRIIRMHVKTTTGNGFNNYDVYIWYTDRLNYFVTYNGSDIGYYSDRLNNYSQVIKEYDYAKQLNSVHIEPLYAVFKENKSAIYKYDNIANLQNTDIYIQYSFEEFYGY